MILCFPNSSFKRKTQYPILKEDGTSLSLTDNYNIDAPLTAVTGTKIDNFTLEITDPEPEGEETIIPFCSVVFAGDNININIDGFDTHNVITAVDVTSNRLKLKSTLLASGSTFLASVKEYTYNILSTCTEGFYRFKDGESLLIRSEIQNMSIDYASVIIRDFSLSSQISVGDFVNLNKEALNSVYADLSYLKDVWNVIDIGQFRELIILKLLAMADHKDSIKHLTNYDNYKNSVINLIKIDTTATPQTDIKGSTEGGAWIFKMGA